MNELESNNISYDTIVMSGGSVKGCMSIGALQYGYDNGLFNNADKYIGTSIGALISYFLCIGYTPIEMMVAICTSQIMDSLKEVNIMKMTQGSGYCSYSKLQEHLEKLTISKIGFFPTMNDIKTKFGKTLVTVTHNYTKQCTEYMSYENYPDLPCLTAIRMSINIPIVFESFQYNGSTYIDGNISDNFPINIGEDIGDKVFGILIQMGTIDQESEKFDLLNYAYKLCLIPVQKYINEKIKNIDTEKTTLLTFDHVPEGNNADKFFDFFISNIELLELFSAGYQKCKEKFENNN